MRAAAHLLGLLTPLSAALGLYLGGWWMAMTIFLLLGLYPIMEFIFGESGPVEPNTEGFAFDVIIPLHAFAVPLNIGYLLYLISEFGFSNLMWLGVISVGFSSATSGIVTAHELGHRRPKSFSWWLARLDLLCVNYLHFTVEHNYTHHKHWARENDPTSSELGRGLYVHLINTIPRQINGAYRTKPKEIIFGFVLQFALLIGLFWISKYVFAAFVIQAAFAIFLLEFTNYLQHHGLSRGLDERAEAKHAWESRNRWSRWTLMELPLHPAHHLKASLPYQKLATYDDAPQLKYGYYTLFWFSLFPPLWHRVMAAEIARNSQLISA